MRILLFLLTNMAVVLVVGVVWRLLGFESFLDNQGIGLDFNPTFFAHERADDNLTLSHPDRGIREFWIEHGKRTREISAQMGAALGLRR